MTVIFAVFDRFSAAAVNA